MNRLYYFLISVLIFFTACDVESVNTIDADGSGYSENVIVIGDQLKAMLEMMGEMDEGENPFAGESEVSSDGFSQDDAFSELLLSEGDTTINFAQLAAEDSLNISPENLDLLSHITMGSKDGQLTFNYYYDNIEQANKLNYLIANLETIEQEAKNNLDKIDIPNYIKLDAKNGVMRISNNSTMSSQTGSLMGGEQEMDDMTKAMFGDSKLTTIYYLPGKVEFLNDPDAIVEGNKVTLTTGLLESMEGGEETPEIVIKYKP